MTVNFKVHNYERLFYLPMTASEKWLTGRTSKWTGVQEYLTIRIINQYCLFRVKQHNH